MNSSEENARKPSSSEYSRNLERLRESPLFSGLQLEPLKVLAYLCARESFRAGDVLFEQEEVDTTAYLVLSGALKLEHRGDDGESRRVASYGEGDFLGGFSLMGDIRRLYTLTAEEDCSCLILTREKFSKTLEQFPDIIPVILEALAQNVLSWDKRLLSENEERGDWGSSVGVSVL